MIYEVIMRAAGEIFYHFLCKRLEYGHLRGILVGWRGGRSKLGKAGGGSPNPPPPVHAPGVRENTEIRKFRVGVGGQTPSAHYANKTL